MLSIRRSWVEIDLKRIIENYRICLSKLPAGCRPMAVVKADAYGHGDKEVAAALQSAGCRDFAVSNANEAQNLREAGVTGSILILGYTPVDMAGQLVKDDVMQALISEEYALELARTGLPVKCQWAVDTGMNRIGLDADDPGYCAKLIRESFTAGAGGADIAASGTGTAASEKAGQPTDKRDWGSLKIMGMFTHLCVADEDTEESAAFTGRQIEKFRAVARLTADLNLPFVHCMNSAGGLYHMECGADHGPGEGYDFCRLGIVMYGLKPSYGSVIPDGIAPAMEWKSVVAMVKTLHPGDTVGYGRTFTCMHDMQIATIPTGYADGYPRSLSNRGYVLIHGKRAPIAGTICMDQMMADVTGISEIKTGDEVVLLGKCGDECYTADDMARTIGTIGYEIICGISKRTERKYI